MDVVKSATNNIDGQFQRIEGLVATVAESVRYSSTKLGVTDEDKIEEILVAFTKQSQGSGIGSFKFGMEATGKISDGSGWKEPAGYDARTRPWYKQAAAAGKGKVNFSDPFSDQITGKLSISVTTAIYDDSGKLLGVIVGDMDIGPITEYVLGLRVFDKGNGALLL